MRATVGGFEFVEAPGPSYYRGMQERIPSLTDEQVMQIEVSFVMGDVVGLYMQGFSRDVLQVGHNRQRTDPANET